MPRRDLGGIKDKSLVLFLRGLGLEQRLEFFVRYLRCFAAAQRFKAAGISLRMDVDDDADLSAEELSRFAAGFSAGGNQAIPWNARGGEGLQSRRRQPAHRARRGAGGVGGVRPPRGGGEEV